MKKWISVCLLLTLLTAFSPAYADMIWEPENQFYAEHSDECSSLDRSYYANGPEGFVTLYDAPGGSTVMTQVENGTRLWVSFRYGDWGCTASRGGEAEVIGWVPMGQLSLIYDSRSFEADYGARFREYQGEFSGYSGPADGIAFWEYPGAPEPKWVWAYEEGDKGFLEALTGDDYFSWVYTDEEGYNWGYINYLYGMRNLWMCMDAPTKTNFPIREIPEPRLIPAKTPPGAYLPCFLVGAVVLVTAVLLFRRVTGDRAESR